MFQFSISRKFSINLIVMAIALTVLGVQGQTKTDIVAPLLLNQPIERQIKGGETHIFQFNIKAGEYARAEVEQKNIETVVSLFAPDGKLVIEMDGRNGRLWREAVSCIAETDGIYQVKIKAYGKADAAGSYTVKLAEMRQVAAKDKLRVEAEKHFNAGEKLYKTRVVVDKETSRITVIQNFSQTAIKEYEAALKIWRELGELYWEGITLLNIGQILAEDEDRKSEAQGLFEQALKIFQDLQDFRGQAFTLDSLTNYFAADKEKVREYAEQLLQIHRKLGNKQKEALQLGRLASIYNRLKQYNKALDYYEQALSIWKTLKSQYEQIINLRDIARVYEFSLEDYAKAQFYLEQSLLLAKASQDKKIESYRLGDIAGFYYGRGEIEKAIKLYEQKLAIERDLKDWKGEINTLERLANIYTSSQQYELALKYLQQALEITRERKSKIDEGDILGKLALTHLQFEDYTKAREFYEQAITIFREANDKTVWTLRDGDGQVLSQETRSQLKEADLTSYFGNVHYLTGNYAEAIYYYNKLLTLGRELKNNRREIISLQSLGHIYNDIGNYEQARQHYEQVLLLNQKSPNKYTESYMLFCLGNVYFRSQQYQKAQDYYERALAIEQAIGGESAGSKTLNAISEVYLAVGQFDRALVNAEKSVNLLRKSKNERGLSFGLNSLGKVYFKLGQYEKAREHFEEALAIRRKIKNRREEAITLNDLMLLFQAAGKPQLAILYGKQAINVIQQLRRNIIEIDSESQEKYVKTIEPTYRTVAKLLIDDGRLIEAQAILELLKDKEYEQLLRSGEKADTVPYSQAEADVIAKIENLVALERERTALQKLLSTNGELSAEQNNKLAKLNLDIAAANKAFDVALDALGKAEASATTRVDEIKGGKVLQSALTELSEKTNSGVVALYTVLGTEEEKDASGKPIKDKRTSKFGWVIMVTENRYTAYPIDVENLEDTVFQFRAALSSDKYNPQPLAEKIYTAIFRQTSPKLKKTLEQDLQDYLKSHPDKTLMWSLDGVLRYIPMAALHDGKQYLVENYQTTVFTKESFVWLMNGYENNWKALGLGVSERRGNFSELPGVKTELETIVREPDKLTGILNGSIKLNDNFKKQTFFNIINGGAFPVVHISSHYNFDSSTPENSFLLAGDGNLTFAEIKQQQNLFKKVDLLTLSACDTGVAGNGKEAEGFAYLAQSLGAKSVIASLWKVSDTGTPELMTRFYQLRKDNPQMSKGEAFRLAQLSLLDTEAKTKETANRSKLIELKREKIELPLFVKDKQKPFAHPHYWSSFVLIGNWR